MEYLHTVIHATCSPHSVYFHYICAVWGLPSSAVLCQWLDATVHIYAIDTRLLLTLHTTCSQSGDYTCRNLQMYVDSVYITQQIPLELSSLPVWSNYPFCLSSTQVLLVYTLLLNYLSQTEIVDKCTVLSNCRSVGTKLRKVVDVKFLWSLNDIRNCRLLELRLWM